MIVKKPKESLENPQIPQNRFENPQIYNQFHCENWPQFHWNNNELKELYTSETTLAQKIVFTPLNNEFELKIWNTTSFKLKNPPEFLKKIHKNQYSASWRGLMVFIHKYKAV